MIKTNLTLTLNVSYVLGDSNLFELHRRLGQVVDDAFANGSITGDSTAEVEAWNYRIDTDELVAASDRFDSDTYTDTQDPETIRRWLANIPKGSRVCVDEGGLSLQVVGNDAIYLEIGGEPEEEEPYDFDQWDEARYDVTAMRFDATNNNFDPDNVDEYLCINIVRESFRNGQFTQAKQQCECYGLNYELQRYKFDGYEG